MKLNRRNAELVMAELIKMSEKDLRVFFDDQAKAYEASMREAIKKYKKEVEGRLDNALTESLGG